VAAHFVRQKCSSIGKVTIQHRSWNDWTSFKPHCCSIHHLLFTSHLLTSPLLVRARTQCEVNNSKRQKLFESLEWLSAAILDSGPRLSVYRQWIAKLKPLIGMIGEAYYNDGSKIRFYSAERAEGAGQTLSGTPI
jgi:hypothetical protein